MFRRVEELGVSVGLQPPDRHASVLLALYRSSFARDHVCIAPYPASSCARLCLCHRLRATHTSGMSQNAIGEHENEKAQNRKCTALISSFNALNLAGERREGETLDLEESMRSASTSFIASVVDAVARNGFVRALLPCSLFSPCCSVCMQLLPYFVTPRSTPTPSCAASALAQG